MQALTDLFGIKDFISHGYGLSWSPVLLWLHVISGLLIMLAYYAILLILVYFIRQRKDLRYPWLTVLFAGSIIACGTLHLLSAITVRTPLYWLDGLLKAFTAIISVATAMWMVWLIPRALFAPGTTQLQGEIQQRKTTENALRESENNPAAILDSVEAFIYIKDCNYQYQYTNQPVQQVFGEALKDITERKQMEEKLRDSDALNVSILNSLTSRIAVLDAQGVIVAVNNAWRRFAKENGLPESGQGMLGVNYLAACKNAFNQPYGDEANAAQTGIMAVLAGELETFHLEYPCHSPNQQRWFYMNVSPLQGSRPGVVVSHKNITVRKKAEAAAQAASQYARSLIEASLDPLVTINAEGKITDVNTATEQVTGVPRVHLIGSDFADYFIDPEKARAGYRQVFSQGFVTDYPLAIRHVSGKVTEVLYNASVYRDGHDNVLGVFAAARDITERKQIEVELTRSNAELEQFAYAVSHDMRQPLRMVSSYLSLIENALAESLNVETQQFLDFAIDGAERMDAMILSLLEYSRIGRKFEAKTWVNSKSSLDEALAFLNPEISACHGEIKVTGDWPELFASGDELTRLLQNLIGNALKYHEENQPPQVHIHGTNSAESLRVEVRDQGIGIEPSQMDRLFKVFSRLQARSRFEGTGVGLALCRKIVEHHNGTLGVESAGEGQGCVFWFELPIVKAIKPE